MEHEDDVGFETISIARCREIMGAEANALSDAEMEVIWRHADMLAHVVISLFVSERSSSR